jgi:hypothetical protein
MQLAVVLAELADDAGRQLLISVTICFAFASLWSHTATGLSNAYRVVGTSAVLLAGCRHRAVPCVSGLVANF